MAERSFLNRSYADPNDISDDPIKLPEASYFVSMILPSEGLNVTSDGLQFSCRMALPFAFKNVEFRYRYRIAGS